MRRRRRCHFARYLNSSSRAARLLSPAERTLARRKRRTKKRLRNGRQQKARGELFAQLAAASNGESRTSCNILQVKQLPRGEFNFFAPPHQTKRLLLLLPPIRRASSSPRINILLNPFFNMLCGCCAHILRAGRPKINRNNFARRTIELSFAARPTNQREPLTQRATNRPNHNFSLLRNFLALAKNQHAARKS